MISLIAQICALLVGLIGLATLIYREYYSPRALARKQAAKDGQAAVDDGDTSGIVAFFDKMKKG